MISYISYPSQWHFYWHLWLSYSKFLCLKCPRQSGRCPVCRKELSRAQSMMQHVRKVRNSSVQLRTDLDILYSTRLTVAKTTAPAESSKLKTRRPAQILKPTRHQTNPETSQLSPRWNSIMILLFWWRKSWRTNLSQTWTPTQMNSNPRTPIRAFISSQRDLW